MNLRILICGEDGDAESVLRELPGGGADFACRVVASAADFEAALSEAWDVVLSDYRVRGFTVIEALEIMKRRDCRAPVIVVSEPVGDEAAAACVRAGAWGFLAKSDRARIGEVIESAWVSARNQSKDEGQFHRVVQQNLAGFYRSTFSGRLLECNEAFARMFGFTSVAEIQAQSTLGLYRTAAERDSFLGLLKSRLKVSNLETPVVRKDGSTIWVLENTMLVPSETGGEPVIEGTMIDITARKQAEEEQSRLRAQLVKIACEWIGTFDAVSQPLVLLDREFCVVRLNRAFKEAAGLPSFTECIGRPLAAISEQEPWRAATEIAENVAAGVVGTRRVADSVTGKTWEIDGGIFSGLPDNDPRIILTFRDVTSLETLQRNLRLSEQHFRTLIENATDLVAVIDDTGVIKYASPAGKRLLGYPREQVLGRAIATLIHPEDREAAQEQIAALRDVPAVARFRLRHMNGAWRSFEFVGVRVSNETMRGIVINARDITDRVRDEEEIVLLTTTLEARVNERTRELAETNAELSLRNRQVENSNRMKSLFLANMSHELRTPLNAIIGFTELLRDQFAGPLSDKQKDYLGHVSRASKHLLGIINEVLDLARIEAGQITLHPETVSLPEFLEEIRDLVAPMVSEKSLTCQSMCEPGLALFADSARLRQILLNLVGNAVKFTPENGSVRITAQRQGGEVTISVIDSGVGIPAQEQEAVFEEFFRASLGAGVSTEGAGLGLPMVRRLTERLGGRVTVRSAPHEGSEFSVTIPVREEEIGARG